MATYLPLKLASLSDLGFTGSLIDEISSCAGQAESTMPPVTADIIRDKLAMLLSPHRQIFEGSALPRFRVVIRRAAVRLAHECRIDYFHQTDRYFYWPPEIVSLLNVIAEDYTTMGASNLLRRSLEWNLSTSENDIVLATVAPYYLHSSGDNELRTAVADVKRGLALLPDNQRYILESRFLAVYRNADRSKPPEDLVHLALRGLCERLNRQPLPLSGRMRRQLRRAGTY